MNKFARSALSLALSSILFITATQSALAVNVAVVDTGIDPAVLGGVLEPGGRDFVNNDDDPADDSTNQHGTAVGVVTVASGSPITLTAIKAFDANTTSTTSVLDAAFNYVSTLSTPVVLHSNGGTVATTPQSLQGVVNSGKLLVISAGNGGGANPTGDAQQAPALRGRGIVVGGLSGGDIGSFSNRAGNLAQYYLLADSHSLTTGSVGTSMASARVAAAAATVMAASPFLRPEQVASLLFETAVDLGAPGTDAVYGQGALDLNAALNPVGPGDVPTDPEDPEDPEDPADPADPAPGGGSSGGGGAGAGAALALVALGLGGAWAAGVFDKEEELKKTILVDKYGRAFRFDFPGRINARDTRPSTFSMFHSGQTRFDVIPMSSQVPGSSTFAFVQEKTRDYKNGLLSNEPAEVLVGFLHRLQDNNKDYVMGLNSDLSNEFGALSFLRGRN